MSKLNVCSVVCAFIAFGSFSTKVQAQIISDGSLNTIVNCSGICNITGGKTDITGKNLFHSFSNFSVPILSGANFNNSLTTENIFARVTGTNSSNINGLIQTNGSANLFLLNPNGIIFGPGASLNINGSFVATTANVIQFGNTGNFGVNTGNNVALLTIKPSALLFNQINPQSIQTNLANLQAFPNKSLLLVGGNLDINQSNLRSPNGHIELAAIQGTGIVQFNQNSNNLSLNPITNITLGNISIKTSSIDSTQYNNQIPLSSGNIQLQGQNITLNQSQIRALTTLGNGGNININASKLMLNNNSFIGTGTFGISPAGNITINASESIELIGNNQSGFFDNFLNDPTNINSLLNSINNTILSLSNGSGKVGDIDINTGNLSIKNAATIGGISAGTGPVGNINVNAKDINIIGAENSDIKFASFGEDIPIAIPNIITGISAITAGNAQNNGDIIINTSEFKGINPGGILNMTLGKGNTGNIIINSLNNIFLDNRSVIGTGSLSNDITNITNIQQNSGQVGNVKITTSQLTFNKRSGISATTFGTGNAGNIELNINNGLLQNGATITTSSGLPRTANINQFNSAKAGNLTINAIKQLTLQTGGVIYSQSSGSGNAGNIIINTPTFQILDGTSGITNSTFGKGDAGNITINANKLDIIGNTPGAFTPSNQVISEILGLGNKQINLNGIASLSFGIGKAGNININSQEINLINGGGIINSNLAEGKGGKIDISTGSLTIMGKSAIISASGPLSTENAGDINIIANTLNLDQGGSIAVDTLGKGNAGNLFIKGENLNIFNGSRISAGTTFDSLGNGGNITLEFANINIMGSSLDQSFPSQISTATNNNGIGGTINIISDILNIKNMGEVNTNTSSSGQAGNINLFIKREINLDNGKILANTLRSSSGNGGSIFIDPELINMKNSIIGVNSQGTGTGGNMEIIVGILSLDNSNISAETISTNGGNITIQNNIIFLNNNSKISTTAGTENAGGNGGNIRIDNQFVIAFPNNNDITANAYFGNGGRVEINTQGLFNILPGVRLTNGNDITASSQFGINGEVIINTPGIDPNPVIKLIEKIENKDVNQVCSPKVIEKNTFITGSGGLPFTPSEQLRNEQYIVNNVSDTNNENKADLKPLVEATNWQKNAQGEIILIANNNNYVQSIPKCN